MDYGLPLERIEQTIAIGLAYLINCWSKEKIQPKDILPDYKGTSQEPELTGDLLHLWAVSWNATQPTK